MREHIHIKTRRLLDNEPVQISPLRRPISHNSTVGSSCNFDTLFIRVLPLTFYFIFLPSARVFFLLFFYFFLLFFFFIFLALSSLSAHSFFSLTFLPWISFLFYFFQFFPPPFLLFSAFFFWLQQEGRCGNDGWEAPWVVAKIYARAGWVHGDGLGFALMVAERPAARWCSSYSGGLGSWVAGISRHGMIGQQLLLLFSFLADFLFAVFIFLFPLTPRLICDDGAAMVLKSVWWGQIWFGIVVIKVATGWCWCFEVLRFWGFGWKKWWRWWRESSRHGWL